MEQMSLTGLDEMKPTCASCHYWYGNRSGDRMGWCRRHSPRTVYGKDQTKFPEMWGGEWCGDYREMKQGDGR